MAKREKIHITNANFEMDKLVNKYDFEDIVQSIPLLSTGEKETLEIMLQENLYREIKERRIKLKKELNKNATFSIEEVLKEIEED